MLYLQQFLRRLQVSLLELRHLAKHNTGAPALSPPDPLLCSTPPLLFSQFGEVEIRLAPSCAGKQL
jgi:hypothetical protein